MVSKIKLLNLKFSTLQHLPIPGYYVINLPYTHLNFLFLSPVTLLLEFSSSVLVFFFPKKRKKNCGKFSLMSIFDCSHFSFKIILLFFFISVVIFSLEKFQRLKHNFTVILLLLLLLLLTIFSIQYLILKVFHVWPSLYTLIR